tara:strand:- start:144 stop:596 length:453 start_codon:yes stop_codon:yes gene_type:complete
MTSNSKGQLFIYFFRLSSYFNKNKFLKIIGFPIRIFYKFTFQWFLGIDIPDNTKIGKGFNVFHGQGLIINGNTIIGDNVMVRQNTTIGNAKPGGGCPIIENNVQVGANCVIIGDVTIGEHSVIGAGSVVIKDVEKYSLVAGNPAKFIKYL